VRGPDRLEVLAPLLSSTTTERTEPTYGLVGYGSVSYRGVMSMPARSADRSPLEAAVDAVKPRLRGWIHAGTFPLALAAGTVLVVLAPTLRARVGAAVFAVTAALLFGTSAVYHRGTWSPRVEGVLKRLDHSNIFLIIAGTYTPFALLLLPEDQSRSLLLIAWAGAVGGVLFRVFWVGAPRWLYTPIYVALGWVAVFYLEPLYRGGGPAVITLIAVGGLLYTLGAVVYGTKRPDPSPRWFGFHEVFHVLTVAAFAVHYVAVSMAVYGHTDAV
jgi:hemolysin III